MAEPKFQPSNGTDGAEFIALWCAGCACEPDGDPFDEAGPDGCPILTKSFALKVTDKDYPPELVEREGHGFCTAFTERPEGWDGKPLNPYAVAKARAAYDALPRDPITGRPVIA